MLLCSIHEDRKMNGELNNDSSDIKMPCVIDKYKWEGYDIGIKLRG